MGTISDRADNFAKKFAGRPPPDNRVEDEKMAEFSKEFDPMAAMKKARTAASRRK